MVLLSLALSMTDLLHCFQEDGGVRVYYWTPFISTHAINSFIEAEKEQKLNQKEVLLADKVHEQEPQCKWLHFTYKYVYSRGICYIVALG